MGDSFHKKNTHLFCCGTPFRETSHTIEKQRMSRQHVLIRSFSSMCENIPRFEYSGGQSVTWVRIHVSTSDGELEGHVV